MSSLPPYSTFRTDNKQMMFPQATSHGNVLTFTPPGFKQSLNVKFPDSRLAVCEKCKKNFKTRDMCRVRNGHSTAPWTTAYICLTLDDSCTDSEGKYVDKPLTVRMVQWQPYQVKTPFDPKTPVCSACKKTNRTRSFCRERHKHRHLPWCTVYVLLSALDTADPSTVVAEPSKPVGGETAKSENGANEDSKDGEAKSSDTPAETPGKEEKASESPEVASSKKEEEKKPSGDDCDDVNDISESRTFLAKVDCKGTTIHWLELAEYDGDQMTMPHPGHMDPNYAMGHQPVQPADPNAHYYHAMGYAAQQHQNALKSHQQYFFHMQQRQQHHHAAQYAAWQAHYGPPPTQVHPPPHSPQHHPPAASHPGDGTVSPAPVTAGEAAAQQQKRSRQMGEENNGQGPPPPGGHPQQQQQQWMLYQQMYQAQLQPVGHSPHYAPRPGQPHEMSPQPGGPMGPEYAAPMPPEGNGETSHEPESKRARRDI